MRKFCIAMYDEDDMPYMIFEDYGETARFLRTSIGVVKCNISRKQKRRYRGEYYMLYKIKLNKDDPEIKKGTPNLHIGAILEVLGI